MAQHVRSVAWCLALAAALSGCGGSGDEGPPPGTPARLSIVSGNGQTAEQHLRIPQDLVVAVLDRDGQPVEGVPVEFTPAPGSPTFRTDWPLVKTPNPTTRTDGVHWFAFFHAPGPHRIVATAAGLPPVIFDVDVTPSTHPYDGPYVCTPGVMTIVHGVQPDADYLSLNESAFRYAYGGVVDETTGIITAGFRENLEYRLRFTGQMTVDAAGQVTVAGTSDLLYHDVPPSLETRPWSCSRL